MKYTKQERLDRIRDLCDENAGPFVPVFHCSFIRGGWEIALANDERDEIGNTLTGEKLIKKMKRAVVDGGYELEEMDRAIKELRGLVKFIEAKRKEYTGKSLP